MNLPQGTLLQNAKYRIEKVLGQGGFGITYLATQVGLNRKVAIKEFFMREYCNREETSSYVSVPSVGSIDLVAKFRQKFIKEAQTIADMENPHIVHIYDVFEDNGTAYYAMQFIDGKSLNDIAPLNINDAIRYIKQISDALNYCHKRKILHLDVKPANILIKDDNAVLIDFGISKHYDKQGDQTSSTPVGISNGYAPLEQYNHSDMSSFTPSTDIYSLGATLYKLVIGQTPPDANYVHENGIELPKDMPVNIKNTITKSMESKRKDRPQSINEFLNILNREYSKDSEILSDDEETKIGVIMDDNAKTPKPSMTMEELENNKPRRKKRNNAWIFILLAIVMCGLGYYIINERIKKNELEKAELIALEQEKEREREREMQEREAAQLAQAQKEMELKAEIDKKREEEEKKLKTEHERLEKEKRDLETQKAQQDARLKLEQELLEIERKNLEAQKAEQERLEQEKKEQEAQKAEQERLEQERKKIEAHNAEQERLEQKRIKKEQEERKLQEEYARTHGTINDHEYVDLGLSSGLKWATCNVGASSPEDYGNYYAWGEVSTKSSYTERNSKTYSKNFDDIGSNSQYDAARANWGSSWRLPTKDELQELKNECTWKWMTQNGIKGYKVIGPNGNSIFLPAAGGYRDTSLYGTEEYSYYWSSSPDESNDNYAYYMHFNNAYFRLNWNSRSHGRSVRPVTE